MMFVYSCVFSSAGKYPTRTHILPLFNALRSSTSLLSFFIFILILIFIHNSSSSALTLSFSGFTSRIAKRGRWLAMGGSIYSRTPREYTSRASHSFISRKTKPCCLFDIFATTWEQPRYFCRACWHCIISVFNIKASAVIVRFAFSFQLFKTSLLRHWTFELPRNLRRVILPTVRLSVRKAHLSLGGLFGYSHKWPTENYWTG